LGWARNDIGLAVNINLPTTASGQIARRTIGNRRSIQRRRVRLDGRLKPAQEIKRRVAICWKALGGVSSDALIRARVTELYEIETLVAQLRADALNGEIQGSVIAALFELNRLTNTANRMRDKLGRLTCCLRLTKYWLMTTRPMHEFRACSSLS
jgi:hypothetical protein